MTGSVDQHVVSALTGLETSAAHLQEAATELDRTLSSVQERLNALAVEIEVWMDFQPLFEHPWRDLLGEDGEPAGLLVQTDLELGYGMRCNEWKLLVRKRNWVTDDLSTLDYSQLESCICGPPFPLLDAPRTVKLAAARQLGPLLEKISKEVKRATACANEISSLVS